MQPDFVFSSESVTAGHPDKLCDQISDAIVDRHLRQDPLARVSAECAVSTGIVFLSVKSNSHAAVDGPAAAREVLRDAGYAADGGFDARTCTVMTSVYELPQETFPRVDEDGLDEAGIDQEPAHDQATVFGYACNDTPSRMPLPLWIAHRLARRLADVQRQNHELSPDGKAQVAVEYRGHRPARIHAVTLLACQRARERPNPSQLKEMLREQVMAPVFAELSVRPDQHTYFSVNPEGPMVPGGPVLHAGLTGRKGAVDGYGDFARHGTAALSGKDPSRIERSGCYAARHAACNVIAAGLAERCEVQLSYAIGLARPVSVLVSTFGTGRIDEAELAQRIERVFDLRPAGIVRRFGLRSLPARRGGVFYRPLSAYGQVGREDLDLPWERTERASELRS